MITDPPVDQQVGHLTVPNLRNCLTGGKITVPSGQYKKISSWFQEVRTRVNQLIF